MKERRLSAGGVRGKTKRPAAVGNQPTGARAVCSGVDALPLFSRSGRGGAASPVFALRANPPSPKGRARVSGGDLARHRLAKRRPRRQPRNKGASGLEKGLYKLERTTTPFLQNKALRSTLWGHASFEECPQGWKPNTADEGARPTRRHCGRRLTAVVGEIRRRFSAPQVRTPSPLSPYPKPRAFFLFSADFLFLSPERKRNRRLG